MLEYVLIAIVVALTALFLIYRFSGSVAGRFKSGGGEVETARVGGESQPAGQGESQTAARGHSGGAPESVPGAAEPEPQPPPIGSSASKGKLRVGDFEFDFSTVLWLGLGVLLVAVLITVRLFGAARAKPKANVDI